MAGGITRRSQDKILGVGAGIAEQTNKSSRDQTNILKSTTHRLDVSVANEAASRAAPNISAGLTPGKRKANA